MADTDPNRSPAFQFYPKDFLTHGIQAGMSLAEAGAYIRLLCHCWRNGGIPDEPDRLARMIGATPREMKAVWPTVRRCFEPHASDPGLLVQPRLEQESQKQADFRRRQSDAALKRWHPAGNAMASERDMPEQYQTDALRSPISDLQSPVQNLSQKAERDSVNARLSVEDELAERAGGFLERYRAMYERFRNGARYVSKPNLDYVEAIELVRTWDDERLDKIATVFLTTNHKFAEEGSRTVAQFRSLASWCDAKLREKNL